MNLKENKIIVTGGDGFLGRHIIKKLHERGVAEENIFVPKHSDYDLRKETDIKKMFSDFSANLLIHLAGKVGGIGLNREKPGELFYDNLMMGVQLIEQARLNNIDKFVAIGTICAYPKFSEVPFREENLWNGYPEETNAPYGLAKKMLLVQSQAYRQQYGFNSIFLLPVNMYGPGDNFNPVSSHVIPALIKDVADAQKDGKNRITVWGDGTATREFLNVEDAAEAIILATENYDKPEPINVGAGFEISIKDLVQLVCKLMNYNGEIVWDTSKPNGQPRRLLDTSKAKQEFGFEAKKNFEEGLKETIDWYMNSL